MKRIIAFLLFITTLATLLALGTWQVQRLQWKNNIIAQLTKVYETDAAAVVLGFNDLKIINNDIPILYGSVQGHLDYTKEILVGPRPFNGEIGYSVITPLTLKNGYILVNRGFISDADKDQILKTQVKGFVTVSGLIRKPDWNKFTPNNNPKNNIWTKLDITQIAQAKNIDPVAPLMMYAEKTSKDFKILKMQNMKWMPRNKHQQYAIFWFSMAFILCGFLGIYNRSQQKN